MKTYPDVAAAGVDPTQHYVELGRFEGRYPDELTAVRGENLLWAGDQQAGLEILQNLLATEPRESAERAFAVWFLSRWHASFGRWREALQYLHAFFTTPLGPELVPHTGPILLHCMALRETGATDEARAALAEQLIMRGRLPDLLLEGASQAAVDDIPKWFNELFVGVGLRPVTAKHPGAPIALDNLADLKPKSAWQILTKFLLPTPLKAPLVTVIIPAFNAANTITTALASLQSQTWRNLEIIVIDDASTDATAEQVQILLNDDPSIRLIRHTVNQGAYAARNSGLAVARGEFITVHDSDDWSHPQKIEHQVRALLRDNHAAASMSHWARCSADLRFLAERMEDRLISLNLSSLMFRRKVFETLGFWDRVSIAADTEYHHRIMKVFGKDSVIEVLPGIPLSFGRRDSKSLTQIGATHWSTFFRGVRRTYYEAALRWHDETANPKDLYLDQNPPHRPFPAPPEICR